MENNKTKSTVAIANRRAEPLLTLSSRTVQSDKFWRWGEDNMMPYALSLMSRRSTPHRRIINDKADYIAGKGFSYDDEQPLLAQFVGQANGDGDSLREVICRLAFDKALMGNAFSVIGSVTTSIVNTVISIVFALYCLSRKEILDRQGRRILYSFLPEHWADEAIRIFRLTNVTFSNFISGQCLEAVILGCLFAVVMAILKLPYIPLVSVLVAVTAFIPVVGAWVGCIFGAFLIFVANPVQALWFVVMFVILQQLENNLIYPKVVGTSIGLSGMWVLLAVGIGGQLMGVAGMFLMIPVFSVFYTLLQEQTHHRLHLRDVNSEKLTVQPPEISSKIKNRLKSKTSKKDNKDKA